MKKLYRTNIYHHINRITIILLAFLSNAANATHPTTLAEAVKLALENNPRINVSKAKVDAASAAILESRGGGLPKLNMEVNGSHSNNPLTVFANKLAQGNASFSDFGANKYVGVSSLGVKPSELNSPGYYNNWNTAVVVNIPLFSGGDTLAKIKKSESLLTAARYNNEYTRTELSYDVLQAYEGVHVTQQLVNVAKCALHAADNYVTLTKRLHEQSLVIESDIIMAENYRRSAQATLQAAIAENDNQLDTFQTLIGKQRSDYIPGASANLSLSQHSLETLKTKAFLSNTQIQTLKSNLEASRAEIGSAKSRNWPQLNLEFRHDWNAQHVSLAGASNTAMLNMNWELFSSGQQTGATRQAVAQYDQAHAELDNISNSVQLNISQTLRSIQTANTQLETSRINAIKSLKVVNESKRRYGQGVLTLGQLLEAQSHLDTAKAQEILARYNLLLAKAKLLALTNELIPNIEK